MRPIASVKRLTDKARGAVQTLAEEVSSAGGMACLVGGAVRDMQLSLTPKDYDIEVFYLSSSDLEQVLERLGARTDRIGAFFGIWKVILDGVEMDVSLPRQESPYGLGHRAFEIQLDPSMTPEVAALRRDYTINSVSLDILSDDIIDPYGGLDDIRNGILVHTSDQFADDPLRVLRGMQFAARFDMNMHSTTIGMCADISNRYDEISNERVWIEWEKWAGAGRRPSAGLEVLRKTEWILQYPEINDLRGVQQDAEWHPEGNVWHHTLHCVNAAALIAEWDNLCREDRVVLVLAALCHDMGKVSTTVFQDSRWRSPGHAEAGEEPTRSFLSRIGAPEKVVRKVIPLVREHLVHLHLPLAPRAVRRLAKRLEPATIEQWGRIVEADMAGRPPLPTSDPARPYVDLAKEIAVSDCVPSPILMGRHLLQLGMKPGVEIGEILKDAFEAQMDDKFDSLEGAMNWVQSNHLTGREEIINGPIQG